MNEYLRAFVIGSSFCVFVLYFYVVSNFNKKLINYDYTSYTFIAPFFLGIANICSLIIAKQFDLSKKMRFFVMSILAPTVVLLTVIYFKIYNYTTISEWFNHIWKLYLLYFIVFNVIMYLLDKYV